MSKLFEDMMEAMNDVERFLKGDQGACRVHIFPGKPDGLSDTPKGTKAAPAPKRKSASTQPSERSR
jgi:hypothetical protein